MSSPSPPAEPHEDQVAAGETEIAGHHGEKPLDLSEKVATPQEPLAESSNPQQDAPSQGAGQAGAEEEDKINTSETTVKEDAAQAKTSSLAAELVESSQTESSGAGGAKPELHPPVTGKSDGQAIAQNEKATRATTPPPDLPSKQGEVRSPPPPPPPPKDDKYLASGQDAPVRTKSPLIQDEKAHGRKSEDADAAEYNEKDIGVQDVDDSRSEIQSIMEQFDDESAALGMEEIMSPRLEFAGPVLESPIHPPRRSSLEPLSAASITHNTEESGLTNRALGSPPPRTSSLYSLNTGKNKAPTNDNPSSPAIHKPPPPEPDPEPDLPFDFHRFLEQLRHKSADPVAKFLRSFLLEFGKKQWMVHEQVKIIGDFLEFISKKMAQCEVWRTVSDAEFDNAREGMEKLVMNRLYSQTFSPAIAPPEPIAGGKSRSRRGQEQVGHGRRGQHQEDVERDEVLAQKVRIYKWVKEEHLDIGAVGDKGRKFLVLAQQELLKIKSYRAPRDKVICVLNCCKVIFGFLRTSQSDQSADAFVPLLIYTVLQANPDHLVSNVQYILRFRNQDKLGGEAGYYISSLMGAVQFIENLDRTSLTISDADFEANVEAAVSAIAERHNAEDEEEEAEQQKLLQAHPPTTPGHPGHRRMPSPHLHLYEKSALSRPEVTPRNSLDAESVPPRRSTSLKQNGSSSLAEPPAEEENAAVAGLLRTIQRPLSTIGRIFSDSDSSHTKPNQPSATPQPGSTPRLSPAPRLPRRSSDQPRSSSEKERKSQDQQCAAQRLSAEDAAARQASAEAEEARRIQRQEHRVVVETLAGMFPGLDREVIDDVVRLKEGRVGLAVDACLALSNP
ncbi:uncharacterized protein BDZ99DRAFT_407180 [Mytilinidion resinicola]|uniref:Guanine nucleotide exchange factor Vps9 n=1 Tax=Mytilinidion resinicola TaxID=574789 RepID=A0A6A6Z854_9PEZI|nr:uncharacterized protein BDZ99DRAFT_407180 [Mytilinidion resinicola]KAF2816407.1 hypothetical protein BDZ99DRAFT_407180 [Mytilinidion resinicola]